MNIGDAIKSNIEYGNNLVESGLEGASTGGKAAIEDHRVATELAQAVYDSWQPALAGACIGLLAGYLTDDRKPARGALVGSLLGAALGFGGGMAWGSRQLTGAMARGAMRSINQARDARWLETNPIDYA